MVKKMTEAFCTKQWQDGEKEADKDVKLGKVATYVNAGDFVKAMKKRRKAKKK